MDKKSPYLKSPRVEAAQQNDPGKAAGLANPVWLRLGMVLLMLAMAGCGVQEFNPVAQPPTNMHQPGKIVWHDLLTSDVELSKSFYGRLFDWTYRQEGDYTIALNMGKPIAGIIRWDSDAERRREAWWLVSISVPDVEKAARMITRLGGKALKGPGDMPGRGRYALVLDPQKAPLVLLKTKDGDPLEESPVLNGWLWDEFWAKDENQALDCYQELAGYEIEPRAKGDSVHYWILKSGGEWRAGLTGLPFEDVPSQWVPAIRVAELNKVLKGVEEFGGKVLIKPDHPLSNGRVALVQDPTGAILMVEEWHPEAAGKEGSK